MARRDFFKGVLASSALLASGHSADQEAGGAYDSVVIGAGVGLTVARILNQTGKRVLVLEARDRIGGQTFTNTSTFGVPFDHGAQWFHQGDINELRSLAETAGYKTLRQGPPLIYQGAKEAPITAHSTVLGAFESGLVAAQQVLTALAEAA
jgi:monoamine oxidase